MTMTPPLDEVLRAHRAGDVKAAGMLVEYCHDRVSWLAERLLPNFARVARHERPSDVAQEALMSLWKSLSTTKPESDRHLLLLAGKKVREALLDLARKQAGKRHGIDHQETQGDVSPEQHAAIAAVDDVTGPDTLDDWSRFHQAIDNLPENERDVALLKWFMNAKDETIAALLGVSESTTQRLWRDAKKRINEEMGGERPR